MSTVARPSGPLPPRVYWTRRLLLVLVLVAVVWSVSRCVGASGSAGPTSAVTSTGPSTAPTTSPPPTHANRSHHVRVTPGVEPVSARLVSATRRCDPSSVTVLPAVSKPVSAGSAVVLHLRLATTKTAACQLSFDSQSLLVSVAAGGETVWSAARCPGSLLPRTLTLQPRWAVEVDVTWSGLATPNGCSLTAPPAEPGRYTVDAAMLQGEPASADFSLQPASHPPGRSKHRPQT